MTEEQMKEVDRLIVKVSNASYFCGKFIHGGEDYDDSNYAELLAKSEKVEDELRLYVRSLVP